jgi:threonine-phosphate decarboxylase
MLNLIKLCKKHNTTLVVDETSIDFTEDVEDLTVITEAIKKNYILVLRSLTKFFALAGLRLGYLIAHKDIINRIAQFQYPWAVNSLAQIALEAAIEDTNYINKSRQFILRERSFLKEKLKDIRGIQVYPPTSNFILCKLTNKEINAEWLFRRLAQRGIIIRNCGNFRGLNNKFFRIAVKKRSENNKLLSALEDIL